MKHFKPRFKGLTSAEATIDALNNRIVNLGAPTTGTDAARLADVQALSGFYGLSVGQSTGPSFSGINKVNFENIHFYVTQNAPNTDEVQVNLRGVAEAGHTHDHGTLTGLGDDDHTQYTLADGTRAFTGNQSMGGNKLTNVGEPTAGTDAARLQDIPPGFYGITAKQTNGLAVFRNLKVLNFEAGNFYLEQNAPNTDEVIINFRGTAGSADHGALGGLGDDDHTQYILADGTRAFTGNQSMGGFRITSLGAPTTGTDAARLQDIGQGFFYGIVVKQDDGPAVTRSFRRLKVLNFLASDFYIHQNVPNTDEIHIASRTTPEGLTGAIQFNKAGKFAGDNRFVIDDSAGLVGQFRGPNNAGNTSRPTYGFGPGPDINAAAAGTGMGIDSNGDLMFVRAGTKLLTVQGTSVTTLALQHLTSATGSPLIPGYAFNSDSDTGIFRVAVDEVGIAAGGKTAARFHREKLTIPGGFYSTKHGEPVWGPETKSLSISNPTSTENVTMFFTTKPIRFTGIRTVLRGTTPTVRFYIKHGTNRAGVGDSLLGEFTGPASSTTTGDSFTPSKATVAVANSWVWTEIQATSGTVEEFHVTVTFVSPE